MALLAPIALAALGADLDAALDAVGVDNLHEYMSPQLLVVCGRVTTASATLRLYRRDEEIGRWVPSAVAAVTVAPGTDTGVFEMRFITAEVTGNYALVLEALTGTVEYVFRPGRA